MPSVKDLRDDIVGLADAQLALVNDARPWSEKRAEFEAREADVKAKTAVLSAVQSIDFDTSGSTSSKSESDATQSLGEFAVKSGFAKSLGESKGRRFTADAPEWSGKAASDPQVTTGLTYPQVDTSIVMLPKLQPTVADLLSAGAVSQPSLTYFVQGAKDGAFTTVAELAAKPQVHYNWSTVTDALTKIAGFTKISDESLEDIPYITSVINSELLYDLSMVEEAQLLSGNGTAPNLRGLLNRVGIQTEARGTVLSGDTAADAIFRAMTKVQTGTYLQADALVLHPTDYQAMRLAKDENGQYYGGGYFTGPYGNGSVSSTTLNVWGLQTVVTSAIPVGTALVGALKQAATVYRKGGVRLEATNTNEDDFIHNRVTVRAEERLMLAVRRPAAIVKVTVSAAP